ncbi:MAG: RES family NAD+ phosphorylase [Bacillota bacterium]|nr:RES family NAD+ phosphorylase [Bacillota bacterium]
MPYLKTNHKSGEIFYRARIDDGIINQYSFQDGPFEAYSKDELGAPPKYKAKDGRINPKGVPYLYLAKTRRCALAEARPPIGCTVAIGKGVLSRDVTVASFTGEPWSGQSLFENRMVIFIGALFSLPLNGQNDIEYLPTQVIAEYLKNANFDGIEYKIWNQLSAV